MTIPLKTFSGAGIQINDEVVKCDESQTINAVVYYVGRLNYQPNSNIEGNTDDDNMVWTGAGGTGTRKAVVLDGLPESTEVAIDKRNGLVYSTTSTTYYVSYTAHRPIRHGLFPATIEWPWTLTASASITLGTFTFPAFARFAYCSVEIIGGFPSADSTITVSNGSQSESITLSSTTSSYKVEFSDLLKIATSQTMSVSTTNCRDAFNIRLSFYDL